MAKTSSIERNKKRERLVKRFAAKRAKLKAIASSRETSAEERFDAKMRIFGPREPAAPEAVLSFSLQGAHPHDIASLLDARGICVRAGHHCAQPLMERFQVPALTRASPYLYNTDDEVRQLFEGLEEVSRLLAGPGHVPATS